MMVPFGLLLAAIALAPLVHPVGWGKHYEKVAYGLGSVTLGYYLFVLKAHAHVLHVGYEYASFIILVGSLFVVAGGIHITVKGEATPWRNVAFLLCGALLANLLGTTGASMLLIRPWIRLNKYRVTTHHIVFFIFIVSNLGGCLTPIGDPPLFLGYLKGVPFWWVTKHCWPMWAVGMGLLLAAFFVVDLRNYRRAPRTVQAEHLRPANEFRFEGMLNLLFLGVILGAVFITRPVLLREGVMLAAAIGSWFATPKHIHEENHFSFHPIQEVAILFAGLFSTMMPALDWLQANAAHYAERLGGFSPSLFFWGCGSLSSVLDNAPTYLGFLSASAGGAITDSAAVAALTHDANFAGLLVAISVSAVFFGANTYIGNGPNFMVKAIADQQKVHTPSFIAYVVKYTLPIMVPLLVLVWWCFFRA
jgi:Na+/H+ antiporter NhaD/arsenite permease-like protein